MDEIQEPVDELGDLSIYIVYLEVKSEVSSQQWNISRFLICRWKIKSWPSYVEETVRTGQRRSSET